MKKFIVAIVLMFGVYFLLTRIADLQDILAVVQRGNILFLSLALLTGFVYLYCLGTFYQSIYAVFRMQESRMHMVKLVTAANFLTVLAPSGGLSAMAVFLGDAQRRNRSKVRVTVAGVLYVWFEYISVLVILILGLMELANRRNLHWSEITASLILLTGALGIGFLIYLGMKSSALLCRVLVWLSRGVNRALRPFIHHDYLDVERARFFSMEVAEGINVLRHHPNWAVKPLLYILLAKTCQWTVLLFCFLAFQVPVGLGTLIAGLSLANLFLIVSPTPAGIGIVEGVLAVALVSLGVPLGDATVVTITYRGVTFWMPFLVGMVTFRLLHISGRHPEPTREEIEAQVVAFTQDEP